MANRFSSAMISDDAKFDFVKINIDKYRRRTYAKFKFIGKLKDDVQLDFVADLEKWGIPYFGGIEYDPDVIMITIVHYIQLCSINPEYKRLYPDIRLIFCRVDPLEDKEFPIDGKVDITHYYSEGNTITYRRPLYNYYGYPTNSSCSFTVKLVDGKADSYQVTLKDDSEVIVTKDLLSRGNLSEDEQKKLTTDLDCLMILDVLDDSFYEFVYEVI